MVVVGAGGARAAACRNVGSRRAERRYFESAKLAHRMTHTLAWLLGIDNATAIDSFDLSLAAQWAQGGAFWLFLLIVALVAGSIAFYLRLQNKGSSRGRSALGVIRGLTLALLLVTLADPVVQLGIVKLQRPLVYLVMDGTDSMSISDELPAGERAAIEKAVGWQPSGSTRSENPSRLDYVQSLLRHQTSNVITRLATERKVDIE